MRLRTIAATLAVSISIGLCYESVTLAQGYVPPNMGIPGRRRGAGTRGDLCVAQGQTLIALAPENSYGQTIDSNPTWFWSLPETNAPAVEFVLLDRSGNSVYETTVASPATGIVSLTLPQGKTLETDADYRWYFSIVCNPDDRSQDIYTEGWVRRIQPNISLMQLLAAADDRATIFAENGLWYDAIATLAADRRASRDLAVPDSWRSLLESVGLSEFADMPLSPTDLSDSPAVRP